MAQQAKQLDELFHEGLKDIYFAEKKILTALPKLAKAARSKDLADAFEKHRAETEEHVARLEEVFKLIKEEPHGARLKRRASGCSGLVRDCDDAGPTPHFIRPQDRRLDQHAIPLRADARHRHLRRATAFGRSLKQRDGKI